MMRDEYDFTNARPNPFTEKFSEAISIKLEPETVAYFKEQAKHSGLPYRTLISFHLTQIAQENIELNLDNPIQLNMEKQQG